MPSRRVFFGQREHGVVQRMESGQRHELKLVSHGAQLALELLNGGLVELALPIEGRRAIVGQHLVRKFAVNAVGEFAGLFEIRPRRLVPQQISIGRVGAGPHDGCIQAALVSQVAIRRWFRR